MRAFPLVFRGVDSVCGCHHSAGAAGGVAAAAHRTMAMLMVDDE